MLIFIFIFCKFYSIYCKMFVLLTKVGIAQFDTTL